MKKELLLSTVLFGQFLAGTASANELNLDHLRNLKPIQINKKYIPIDTMLPANAIIEFCCVSLKAAKNSFAMKDLILPGNIVVYASRTCTSINTMSIFLKYGFDLIFPSDLSSSDIFLFKSLML